MPRHLCWICKKAVIQVQANISDFVQEMLNKFLDRALSIQDDLFHLNQGHGEISEYAIRVEKCYPYHHKVGLNKTSNLCLADFIFC